MSDLHLLPIGCQVMIGESIKASINQVCIAASHHVTYQCVWWNGNDRKTDWLEESEIAAPATLQRQVVGFARE